MMMRMSRSMKKSACVCARPARPTIIRIVRIRYARTRIAGMKGADYDKELLALGGIEKSIEREEALLDRERQTPAIDDPNERAAAAAGAPGQRTGFASFGEFLSAVILHERSKGRRTDPRLVAS